MDQENIESPRSNPITFQENECQFSNRKRVQPHNNPWNLDIICELSHAKNDTENQPHPQKPFDYSQYHDLYGRISPLHQRLPRRPIFDVDNYKEQSQKLQTMESENQVKMMKNYTTYQKKPFKIQQIDKNSNLHRQNINKIRPTKDVHQFNQMHANQQENDKSFDQQTNSFKTGSNRQRKRAPLNLQQKPIYKKFSVLGFQKKYQEQQQKEKKQRIHPESKDFNKKQIICFHCGGPHYADQCTEQNSNSIEQLKCLNCKKRGHTAKFCLDKWRCTVCQSNQHIAKDCPQNIQPVKIQQKICAKCLQSGHFARQCKNNTKCFQCKQYGHQKKDCPNLQNKFFVQNRKYDIKPKTCFNCKKNGHYANQCKQPLKCHKCGLKGHFSRDCTSFSQSLSLRNQKNQNNSNFYKK